MSICRRLLLLAPYMSGRLRRGFFTYNMVKKTTCKAISAFPVLAWAIVTISPFMTLCLLTLLLPHPYAQIVSDVFML